MSSMYDTMNANQTKKLHLPPVLAVCRFIYIFFDFDFGHRLFHLVFYFLWILYAVSSVSVSAATHLEYIYTWYIYIYIPGIYIYIS